MSAKKKTKKKKARCVHCWHLMPCGCAFAGGGATMKKSKPSFESIRIKEEGEL